MLKKEDFVLSEEDFKWLNKFRELGLINEIAMRDYHIRRDYIMLTRGEGMKSRDAEDKLAEMYHVKPSTVHTLLYRNRNKTARRR